LYSLPDILYPTLGLGDLERIRCLSTPQSSIGFHAVMCDRRRADREVLGMRVAIRTGKTHRIGRKRHPAGQPAGQESKSGRKLMTHIRGVHAILIAAFASMLCGGNAAAQ